MFALEPHAASWFLLFAGPVSIWAACSDLATMKIRNVWVLSLLAGYATLGLIVLPLDLYLWRYLHCVVVLTVGLGLNLAGGLGAGDAKFMAAAAPMVAAADAGRVLMLLGACMLLGFVLHRALRASPLRRARPQWSSWDAGRKFPMGLPLALALLAYLGIAAVG